MAGKEADGLAVEIGVGLSVRPGIAVVGVEVAIVADGDEVNSVAVGLVVSSGPVGLLVGHSTGGEGA